MAAVFLDRRHGSIVLVPEIPESPLPVVLPTART